MKCNVRYGIYKIGLLLPNLPQGLRKQCSVVGPFESHMECTVSLLDMEKDFSTRVTFLGAV